MYIFKDDMKKESKLYKYPMILFFALATLFPFVSFWNDIKTADLILGVISFLLISCFFLYGYLYAYKYNVIVFNNKIVLNTLFKSIEIQYKDIKSYSCRRYKKSVFFQFSFFCKEKKYIIYTRYRDELEELLKK